jgi:hypothetical protein
MAAKEITSVAWRGTIASDLEGNWCAFLRVDRAIFIRKTPGQFSMVEPFI